MHCGPEYKQKRNEMESLNRIELKGRVGNVRVVAVGSSEVIHFSLVTDIMYKTRDGVATSEVSWHSVTAWPGKNVCDFSTITKGAPLHVVGRMKYQKYTTSDGVERDSSEVIANLVEKIEE